MAAKDKPTAAPAQPRPPRLLRPFVYVFLAALLIRLLWVAHAHVTPISDFFEYHRTAVNWLETGQYRIIGGDLLAYRSPGYVAFLAVVYAVFGVSPVIAGLVQAVLGALTGGLLVVLVGRTVSPRVGSIAGFLYAFWPLSIVYVPCLASDNLSVFLIVAGLNCLFTAHRRSGTLRNVAACVAGLCYGSLFLTRPAMVFLLPAWFALALFDPARRRWQPRTLVLCMLAAGLVISPWLVRNYRLGLGVGTFSTQGGYALWWGNNWETRDGGTGSPPRFPGDRELSETEHNRFFRQKAIEWISQNPRRYLGLCRARLMRIIGKQHDLWAAKYFWPTAENDDAICARYWASRGHEHNPELARYAKQLETRNRKIHTGFRVIVVPLIVLAMVLSLTRLRAFAYVLLPLACFVLGHSLTVFAARYRIVSDPLMLALLAALLSDLRFGSRDLCPWGGRWAKGILAVAAVAASVWIHVSGADRGWYRLPPNPAAIEKAPEFGPALGKLVEIDLTATEGIRNASTRSCDIERIATLDGLRYELRGTPDEKGHQYGGARFSVPGVAGIRAEISFENVDNIDAVFIDGHDADGTRRLRWTWSCRDETRLPPSGQRIAAVFVPGEQAREFRATVNDTSVPITDLRLLVRVKHNTTAAFVIHSLEIAVPPQEP